MNTPTFDPIEHLDRLLGEVGLNTSETGGNVELWGADPIVQSRLRLGACIGIPVIASAVAAASLWKLRTGQSQDLSLDLRQAIHGISSHAFWHPTVAGERAPHPLVIDNPFLLDAYETRDKRTVMACAVYPHQVVKWCRFLDVPPDRDRVAEALGEWNSFEIEREANDAGLPTTVVRTPREWKEHPQGGLLSNQPVISIERIGDAPPRDLGRASRPLDGVRVLSFTHAVAGPTVGRTLSEQGAEVLCVTRPNDFEHDFIYVEANIGSRSTYLDLASDRGRSTADELLSTANVVVNNHRPGKLEALGIEARELAKRHPGIICVSVSCYGHLGPWATRGGFDMNGSAASGLMTLEGSRRHPKLPITGLINDFITGYMGAVGATAALGKQAQSGGSWHVNVSLTRTAMWYLTLGLVDPLLAGTAPENSLRDPDPYDAPSAFGDLHTLAPPVKFSLTPPVWPEPPLVVRGSSRPSWNEPQAVLG